MSERTDGRSEQREIFLTSRPKGAASRRSSSIPAPPATGEIALRPFLRRLGQRHILPHDDVEDDDKMEKALSEFTFFRSRTSILVCLFRIFDQFFRGLPEVTFRSVAASPVLLGRSPLLQCFYNLLKSDNGLELIT